ncbi:MAG TPA: Ig-like domain-containing protein, partial [Verrucomicrobiota bacterium]|nr:Ig-like domain-containing protein [Verrucomicrobiota bacterium]
TVTRSFTVRVNAVNDAPTLDAIANQSVAGNGGVVTVGLSGISSGAANEADVLVVSAVSSNPGLVPHPTVSYVSPGATGSLRLNPAANQSGSAVITVTVNDGQAVNHTVTRSFTVAVDAVNAVPTLGAIGDVNLDEDAGVQTVNLSGISAGGGDVGQALTVRAVSSNPGLIPHPTVNYVSPGATGSLQFRPVADGHGTAVVTVTVDDGQAVSNTVTRSFTVRVNAVNDAPTISTIAGLTVVSDTNSGPVAFTINDKDTPLNSLSLTAASTQPAIISPAGIMFGGSGTNRTVRITPTPGSSGVVGITVTVSDGAASASTMFNVTVQKPQPAVGQLSVVKNGEGTVIPDLENMTLIVGQTYTVTAVPAAGYLFSSWSGSVASTSPTLTFTMSSNTVIQVNFIADPYVAAAGTYNGLFNETDEVRLESSGNFNVYVNAQGQYSAWVQMGYIRYPFSGVLSQELRATNTLARWEQSPVVVELLVGQGGSAGQIFGRITDGRWTAQLSGGRPASRSALAGEYTAVFPGIAGDLSRPAGDGFATIHVASDGLATMNGTLADGRSFMQSAYITVDGDWPLGVSLYAGKGLILSWVSFTNQPASDLSGDMVWLKQAGDGTSSYPLGFAFGTKVVGSAYVAPAPAGKAVDLSGGVVSFSGGDLVIPFHNVVSVNAGSQVVNLSPNLLNFRITPGSGLFTGEVQSPDGGPTRTFNGVLLQKLNAGYGTLSGTSLSSRVVLQAP